MKIQIRNPGKYHIVSHGINESFIKINGKLISQEFSKGHCLASADIEVNKEDIIECTEIVKCEPSNPIEYEIFIPDKSIEFNLSEYGFEIGENFGKPFTELAIKNFGEIKSSLIELPFTIIKEN